MHDDSRNERAALAPDEKPGEPLESETSQSVPFPLISAADGLRQRAAPHVLVPRTHTLSGPPVRIPALPMLTVVGTESASDVQVAREQQVSPKSTRSSNFSWETPIGGCTSGALRAACSSEPEGSEKLAHATGSTNDGPNAGPRLFFGRYEMVCQIGRGGMSTVYLCRVHGEAGFHRLFALKALRPELSRDPLHTQLFLQEARVAAGIHHPNVVSILDAGVCDGQPYVVMDYVEGLSLSGLLDRSRLGRSPRLLVPIIMDTLNGLHAAHESTAQDGTPLDLVHCDVSPQNLLVGTDGIGRITDFGVARARGLRKHCTHGKPAFLSPEQLIGEDVDRRSDIFSIGTVMWCALTGEQLFKSGSLEATMTNVIRRRIEPPSEVGLKPPACLDAVVLKALERDPVYRFQTAAEMLDALREIAVKSDLFGAPSEVAAWVQRSSAPDLERRRRTLRDRTCRATGGSTAFTRLELEPRSVAESASKSASSTLVDAQQSEISSTLTLARPTPRMNLLLFGALIISLVALGMSLLYSSAISRIFSTSGSGVRGIGVGVTWTKGAGGGPTSPDQ